MTIAIDTDFLVAVEIRDHLFHKSADELLGSLLEEGHKLAVAPQMLEASACTQGISSIVTNNEKDFKIFGRLKILAYNQQESQ
jgi:predicted nucleic acid-binding protein